MNQQAKAKALSLAYEIVISNTNYSKNTLTTKLKLNERTLRRIRSGGAVKDCTFEYAIGVLYDMIDSFFQKDIKDTGGVNSTRFLMLQRTLLKALLGKL